MLHASFQSETISGTNKSENVQKIKLKSLNLSEEINHLEHKYYVVATISILQMYRQSIDMDTFVGLKNKLEMKKYLTYHHFPLSYGG